MEEQLFLDLQDYFDHYVSNYSFTDPYDQQNIDLKYEHSYQVKNNMVHLTADILEQKDSYIAQTIALFHDIGRFKQYQKYKTFADAKSEDHAQLGVDILQNKQILSTLESRISELILKAISYHNKPHLPNNESAEVLLYTKLIRDADKLDIWRVVLNEYTAETTNGVVGLGLEDTGTISEGVYQQVINQEVVKYEDLQTLADFKLLQMAWVYELNFPQSFALLAQEEYITRLFATMESTDRAQAVYTTIKSYLAQKLAERN